LEFLTSKGNLRRFPQLVADFSCTAARIQDLGGDAVTPDQVAAFRLGVWLPKIASGLAQMPRWDILASE
jgi:hypothetical protein